MNFTSRKSLNFIWFCISSNQKIENDFEEQAMDNSIFAWLLHFAKLRSDKSARGIKEIKGKKLQLTFIVWLVVHIAYILYYIISIRFYIISLNEIHTHLSSLHPLSLYNPENFHIMLRYYVEMNWKLEAIKPSVCSMAFQIRLDEQAKGASVCKVRKIIHRSIFKHNAYYMWFSQTLRLDMLSIQSIACI